MMKPSSTKLQTAERIRYVQECILNDYSTREILQAVIQKFVVTERQAYRYIWAANLSFEEQSRKSIQKKVAYYLARKRRLIRDMDPNEKKSPAGVAAINKVLDSMAKLEGVTMDTLKLVGDPENPVVSRSEVNATFTTPVDYTLLPTEFLKQLVSARKAS